MDTHMTVGLSTDVLHDVLSQVLSGYLRPF